MAFPPSAARYSGLRAARSRKEGKARGAAPSTPAKGGAFGIHYFSGLISRGLRCWWQRLRRPLLIRPLKQLVLRAPALGGVQGQRPWPSFLPSLRDADAPKWLAA